MHDILRTIVEQKHKEVELLQSQYSIDDLMRAGERAFTIQRLINIRDGYDAKTDVMPKRMFNPAKKGFRAGKVLPFMELMKDYYEWRGWDENGKPSQKTLERLGLPPR